MSFDVLNNPLNERRWEEASVMQRSGYGKTLDMKSATRGRTHAHAVTYLSGSCLLKAACGCMIVT